jgi:hypothetical protein
MSIDLHCLQESYVDGPGRGKRSSLSLCQIMHPSVPSEALWQFDRLELFDITAQLQHGIQRVCCRAVCEAGGQAVPPPLKTVQQVCQRLNCVRPLLRSTAPIGRAAVSDNHRRLCRRSCDDSLAPRPIGCRPLGWGRGAIAAGWWSWHLSLISRDASRVQWIDMHHHLGVLTAVCRLGRGSRPRVVSKQLGVPS